MGDDGELTDAARTWATGLSGVTGEQIAKGLHACVDDASGEWPSLPMFKAKCLAKAVNGFGLNYTPECYREQHKVPHDKRLSSDERNKRRKEIADKHLPGLRDALK